MKKSHILIVLLMLLSTLSISAFGLDTPNYYMTVADDSPASDTMLLANLNKNLESKGYDIKKGTIMFISELKANLDDTVALFIYKGVAVISVGKNSPASHVIFASDISKILDTLNVNSQRTILSSELQSDYMALFDENYNPEEKCIDSDNGKKYYDKGYAKKNGESKYDVCLGANKLSESYCENNEIRTEEYVCHCSDGACKGTGTNNEDTGSSSSSFPETLKFFPGIFVSSKEFQGKIIVGDKSSAAATLAASDIYGAIQSYLDSKKYYPMSVGTVIFESELKDRDQNLIIIGKPKAYSDEYNSLIGETGFPKMEDEKGYIFLQKEGKYWRITVTAKDNERLRAAAYALANYQKFNFGCTSVEVTGTYPNPVNVNVKCKSYSIYTEKTFDDETEDEMDSSNSCSESDNGLDWYAFGLTKTKDKLYKDECKDEKTLIEFTCKNEKPYSEEHKCSDDEICEDGACKKDMKDLCTDNSDCDDQNACTSNICSGTPKKCSYVEISKGCSYDGSCIPVGTRTDSNYCDIGNSLKEQKRADEMCNNNYECKTNFCIDNTCTEPGIMTKLINWFKNIFS